MPEQSTTRRWRWEARDIAPLVSLLVLVAFFSAVAPNFRRASAIYNIFDQGAALAIVAAGLTFVLIAAEVEPHLPASGAPVSEAEAWDDWIAWGVNAFVARLLESGGYDRLMEISRQVYPRFPRTVGRALRTIMPVWLETYLAELGAAKIDAAEDPRLRLEHRLTRMVITLPPFRALVDFFLKAADARNDHDLEKLFNAPADLEDFHGSVRKSVRDILRYSGKRSVLVKFAADLAAHTRGQALSLSVWRKVLQLSLGAENRDSPYTPLLNVTFGRRRPCAAMVSHNGAE